MAIVLDGNTIYTAANSDDDVTSLTFVCFSILPAGLGKGSVLTFGEWSAKVTDMKFTGDTYAWGLNLYPVVRIDFDTPTHIAMPKITGITVW